MLKRLNNRNSVKKMFKSYGIDPSLFTLERRYENGASSYGLFVCGTEDTHIRVIKYYDERFYRVDVVNWNRGAK